MDTAEIKAALDHSSFTTAFGTLLAYVLVLVGMTVVLFGIPYLLFILF